MKRYDRLADYEFVDCMVRSREILGFVAQRFEHSDPLEPRETAAFYYYPDDPPKRRWAFVGLGEATGICGTAVMSPAERWVLVMDDGAVFVSGGGTIGYEDDIPAPGHSYFTRVRMLRDGRAYAVGGNRSVYVRHGVGDWTQLADGLEESDEATDRDARGFRDVCETPAGEVYACGGRGDLWMYRDESWHRLEVPTDSDLRRIVCDADGRLYILAEDTVIVGRENDWKVQNRETDVRLENMVVYQDRVLVSSRATIFEVSSDRLVDAQLDEPTLSGKSRMAAGDGVLLVAGVQDAAMFDGTDWTVILEPN